MAEDAKSLSCDICGVRLRNAVAAQVHAEKTDHQSFSESTEEIKPLTEEEKQAKLQELREKLAAKRKLEADKELENVKKNSAIERKKTQESGEIIEELKRKEELKQIAAKRKEKEDDLKAKQRVRAQLEQDKRDRAERTRLAQAARAGLPQVNAAASTPEVATTKSRDVSYTTARLQIRFAGTTKPITGTWDKTTTMLQVAEEIHSQTGVEPSNATFKMFGMTIAGTDLRKTLEELKLVPSASLQLS